MLPHHPISFHTSLPPAFICFLLSLPKCTLDQVLGFLDTPFPSSTQLVWRDSGVLSPSIFNCWSGRGLSQCGSVWFRDKRLTFCFGGHSLCFFCPCPQRNWSSLGIIVTPPYPRALHLLCAFTLWSRSIFPYLIRSFTEGHWACSKH